MSAVIIRQARLSDRDSLAAQFATLWPDGTVEEHAAELSDILAGRPQSTLPLVVLVAESAQGELLGFAEVGLRSHADGCDGRRPVGYLEGWFVAPDARRTGVGRALIAAAEDWSRAQGCVEMASDTWLDREESQRAHAALGFEEVDRCVNFRKSL
jgi:aminoglycoside 6'-N-acetyltransferase I